MKLTEGGKLERPNVCFLCETTPAHGTKVIDTERYFDGHPFNLQGRRYVCEKCINDMVKFFNFADRDAVDRAYSEANEARLVLRSFKWRIDQLFNDLKNLAESPHSLVEAAYDVEEAGFEVRTVGSGADAVADPGEADDSPGEVEVGADEEPSPPGRPSAPDDTYSGASLSTSPYAQ